MELLLARCALLKKRRGMKQRWSPLFEYPFYTL